MQRSNHLKSLSLFVLTLLITVSTVISPFKVKAEVYNIYYPNTNSGYEAWVNDACELLTETEAEEILQAAYDRVTDYSDIYIFTVEENPFGDGDNATKDYADDIYASFCESDSCVIFMLDLYAGYIRIDAYGNAKNKLTADQRGEIIESIVSYTSDKKYYECILCGIDEISGYVSKGNKSGEVSVNNDTQTENTKGSTASSLVKSNSESGYRSGVFDDADLLSQSEEKALLEEAYKYTEFGDIFVVTSDTNPYGNSEGATATLCKSYFDKYSSGKNCVIFIIDMHTRYIYIDTYGDQIRDNLTNGKCDTITDNVYEYASDKDYYQCSMSALEQIGKVLNGMAIAEPMKIVSNLFIAFVVGFVIMYLVALSKSKVRENSDNEMLKYAAVNFAANNPQDITTGTTKTYCPRSSGSGGGRSGGGGGGGSHGGGGHRF